MVLWPQLSIPHHWRCLWELSPLILQLKFISESSRRIANMYYIYIYMYISTASWFGKIDMKWLFNGLVSKNCVTIKIGLFNDHVLNEFDKMVWPHLHEIPQFHGKIPNSMAKSHMLVFVNPKKVGMRLRIQDVLDDMVLSISGFPAFLFGGCCKSITFFCLRGCGWWWLTIRCLNCTKRGRVLAEWDGNSRRNGMIKDFYC